MTNGTVQNPLSNGEILEFATALMQQFGRKIKPDKAWYYIRNKRQLGADLAKLDLYEMPEFDITESERFYVKHSGLSLDFSTLPVPPRPDYPCRAIVVLPSITNNRVFDACTKTFDGKTWRYEKNLDTVTDVVKRPEGPYVTWVRDTVEADPDMANKSASDIETAGTNTLTLKERMLFELRYFNETGKHLDIDNWTLCAGSRYADGGVPACCWGGGEFCVGWAGVGDRNPYLRARVAVS